MRRGSEFVQKCASKPKGTFSTGKLFKFAHP